MSLFDEVLESQTDDTTCSPQEALIALLVSAAQADARISREEAVRFNNMIGSMRIFRDQPSEQLGVLIQKMMNAAVSDGANQMIARAAASLPSQLRETAFTLATDLMLADGNATEQEKKFIDELQQVLKIDDEFALKVVEVMLAKNAGQ